MQSCIGNAHPVIHPYCFVTMFWAASAREFEK